MEMKMVATQTAAVIVGLPESEVFLMKTEREWKIYHVVSVEDGEALVKPQNLGIGSIRACQKLHKGLWNPLGLRLKE